MAKLMLKIKDGKKTIKTYEKIAPFNGTKAKAKIGMILVVAEVEGGTETWLVESERDVPRVLDYYLTELGWKPPLTVATIIDIIQP